ncbi:MAG: glycosyltransferase family 39 protein [Anaerolineaceae bacterium]|nr:glycosyltransferase family 39 protein [Anaerolineaceae bacterium]
MKKFALPLILLSYTVLAVVMSLVVPLGESPDEIDHFLYVRYLLENRAFPVMHPVAADNATMEANQPPLFYLLNAAATAPFPMTASADFPLNACFTFDPHDGGRAHFYLHQPAEQNVFASDYLAFRAARLVSVLLGLITVWLAYRLGRQMVPGDKRAGLLAAAFLAFNPQFLFMTASVNNDVLTAVLGAALVYVSVQATGQPTLRRFVALGVLMGLALLTKFALLAFWPLPLLAVLLSAGNGRKRQALQNGAVVLGLPLLIAGWWYVRAAQLYGDPLAWDVHLQAKGSEVLRTSALTLADLRDFVVIHFQSYWAWFGWLKIQAPGWVYGLLAVMVAVAAMGLVLVARDWRLEIGDWWRPNLQSPISNSPVSATAVLFNVLAAAAIYASLLRYIQTINWSGYQGRLAYAAAGPIAALLALGWWRLTLFLARKTQGRGHVLLQKWAAALPVLGLLVLALASLVQLREAFARPLLYMPPAGWPRVCQVTADGFFVEAVDFPVRLLPGDVFTVSLAGYPQQGPTAQGQILLLNWDGSVLDAADLRPSSLPGLTILDTLPLTVPPGTLPTAARLVYTVNDQTTDLARLKVAAGQTAVPTPAHKVDANFANQITLLGYDLQVADGQARLTTYWQALRPLPTDYTIFLHLLGTDGSLIAQHDGQPQGGRYPTSIWDTEEVVVDEVTLTWPPDEAPAQVALGLYRLDTLERLALVGDSAGQTAVTLPLEQNP